MKKQTRTRQIIENLLIRKPEYYGYDIGNSINLLICNLEHYSYDIVNSKEFGR